MINYIKDIFRTPSASQLAMRELQIAECEVLHSLSVAEYAVSMAEYHDKRIRRLKSYISTIKE